MVVTVCLQIKLFKYYEQSFVILFKALLAFDLLT